MITGKIILTSSTKVSLDQRFGEIAKQAPPTPRFQQQPNIVIPRSRQDTFVNKRSTALNTANRLKKRSINYRIGLNNNTGGNRQYTNPKPLRVFQRLGFGNGRRGVTNSYLFGGQSGMGIRLRGQGRTGTRIFRSRTRGYLNNNSISRFSGYSKRGNQNTRGVGRIDNKPNRGRGGNKNLTRGRGNGRNNRNNNNSVNVSKQSLDDDLETYMGQTKLDNDSIEMNTI